MNDNFFKKIPSYVFTHTQDLSFLSLEDNVDIDDFDGQPFKKLSKLTSLSLSGSGLKSIPYDAFLGLNSLREIDLSDNRLEIFPREALKYLSHLEKLEVGSNKFESLEFQDMYELKNLKYFAITGCKNEFDLNFDAFQENTKLVEINITKCAGLMNLQSETFANLPHLRRLNLHQCGLTRITQDLADWTSLEYFDISNNHLHCDCTLGKLYYFTKIVSYSQCSLKRAKFGQKNEFYDKSQ